MRILRWAVDRLLPFLRRLGVGFVASARQLSPRAAIWMAGLLLIGVGGWGVSPQATLFLIGLFLIRDAERKPSDE